LAELWGLLADDDRLRVFAAIALGAASIADIAAASGVDPRAVVKALQRLESGGVVAGKGSSWELRREVIAEQARRTATTFEPYDEEGLGAREASVLRAFLRDGRLVSIPTVRSKRLIVLDHVAKVFEIGVRYPEREVDALLRVFHADYAALRRHLVDEAFLARDHAVYWRTGGSVVV
jgi:hypothetical protein